jgi:acid phosphatase type 7
MKIQRILIFFLIINNFSNLSANSENQSHELKDPTIPRQIVLTWQQNPSSSMTITWRTDDSTGTNTLSYELSPGGIEITGKTIIAESFTFAETKAWLHTAELTGLKPNTEYNVTINHPSSPEKFYFRTLPSQRGEKDLVFLAGGDSRTQRDVRREMNQLAIEQDPDFIIFDGDFIQNALNEQEWDDWFDDWHEQMITPDGRRIPVVPAIGNHEVSGGYLQSREKAPFYLNRFITPEPRNYYALEFGPDMVLVTLDTDHLTEVTEQTPWLDSTLTVHQNKRWKLIQWHVAAWPSVRDFNGDIPVKIRASWIPLIEKHNVHLVIEAHDHAYKKTVPIRNNQRDDENGIIYIGDGGWGAPTRETKKPDEFWWLDEALKIDHFWKITLPKDASHLMVEPIFRPPGKSFKLN